MHILTYLPLLNIALQPGKYKGKNGRDLQSLSGLLVVKNTIIIEAETPRQIPQKPIGFFQ